MFEISGNKSKTYAFIPFLMKKAKETKTMEIRKALKDKKRIVIKVGTSTVTYLAGRLHL